MTPVFDPSSETAAATVATPREPAPEPKPPKRRLGARHKVTIRATMAKRRARRKQAAR